MFAEDRARRHHVRAQRAKLSAAALAAREAMALQLLEARNAAVKARRHPSVANNPAAADAAAVAAAIGAATGSLRCAFGAPANNHVLRVLSSFLFLFLLQGYWVPTRQNAWSACTCAVLWATQTAGSEAMCRFSQRTSDEHCWWYQCSDGDSRCDVSVKKSKGTSEIPDEAMDLLETYDLQRA